jgi:hypothetical protein
VIHRRRAARCSWSLLRFVWREPVAAVAALDALARAAAAVMAVRSGLLAFLVL